MEKHGPPKIRKRRSTLTLNKKGNKYYSRAKEDSQNVLEMHLSSETADFPHLTHPLDHVEVMIDNFVSQSEDSEKSSAENKQYFFLLQLSTRRHQNHHDLHHEGKELSQLPQKLHV